MMYAIRNQDGEYFTGGDGYRAYFAGRIERAKLYSAMAPVTTALRRLTSREKQGRHTGGPLTVVEVDLVVREIVGVEYAG